MLGKVELICLRQLCWDGFKSAQSSIDCRPSQEEVGQCLCAVVMCTVDLRQNGEGGTIYLWSTHILTEPKQI